MPHSITTKEYLPPPKQSRNAVPHLQLLDQNVNRGARGSGDLVRYSAVTFPNRLKFRPTRATRSAS